VTYTYSIIEGHNFSKSSGVISEFLAVKGTLKPGLY